MKSAYNHIGEAAMRKKRKDTRPVCRCNAYDFPHKLGGGSCDAAERTVPNCLVSYVHSRQAWIDAGVSEKDFG